MMARLRRPLAAGLLGAFAGAAWLVLVYGVSPGFSLALDADLTDITRGFDRATEDRAGPSARLESQAAVRLDGLDRRVPWACAIRLRAGSPDAAEGQTVSVSVDGIEQRRATGAVEDIEIEIPARPYEPGATVGFALEPGLLVQPGDVATREVVLSRFSCTPAGGQPVLPPRTTLGLAASAAGVLAAAFGTIGITAGSAVGAAVMIGLAQAGPLAAGTMPYSTAPRSALMLALAIGAALVTGIGLADRVRAAPLRHTARFVAAFSASALYLELLVLLPLGGSAGTAALHGQRLLALLHGVSAPLPPADGRFPSAIALYLAAAPLTFVSHHPVWLLRVLVAVTVAAAGVLLYIVISRVWADRLTAAGAVALLHLTPIAFSAQAAGALTMVFGQSLAIAAMAVIVMPPNPDGGWRRLAVLSALLAAGFLSHPSTFVSLVVTVPLVALLCAWRGPQVHRRTAVLTILALLIAATTAGLAHVLQPHPVHRQSPDRLAAQAAPEQRSRMTGVGGAADAARTEDEFWHRSGPARVASAFGWPLLALALLGSWRVIRSGLRDTLSLGIAAWVGTCLLLVLAHAARADLQYDVAACLAAWPAAAALGSVGAGWAWRRGPGWRVAAAVFLTWVIWVATANWLRWVP